MQSMTLQAFNELPREERDALVFGPRVAAVAYAARMRTRGAGRISADEQRKLCALMRREA